MVDSNSFNNSNKESKDRKEQNRKINHVLPSLPFKEKWIRTGSAAS